MNVLWFDKTTDLFIKLTWTCLSTIIEPLNIKSYVIAVC